MLRTVGGGHISLERLSMFPLLLEDSLRMGFARIGKGCITYSRNSVKRTDKSLDVGGYFFTVEIILPATNTKKRNLIIALSTSSEKKCEFSFFFSGYDFKIIRKRFFKECPPHIMNTLRPNFLNNRKKLNSFFREFFTPFRYEELGIYNKNVRQYFDGDRYRLSLIQFMSNPILLAKKI